MKWVTREKVKVDRAACPWLIKKSVDPQAEFLFVPGDKVLAIAEQEGATPYDVPGVELGHHEGRCSFEAIITKYGLKDPALHLLAQIVHGADVQHDLYGRPEAPGLLAVALGFSMLGLKDDHEIIARESVVYDALYAYCDNLVRTIKAGALKGRMEEGDVVVLDVRRQTDFAADPQMLPGALRKDPEQVDAWAGDMPKDKDVVIYCVRGGSVSNTVLDVLLDKGIRARYLEGGIEAWKQSGRK